VRLVSAQVREQLAEPRKQQGRALCTRAHRPGVGRPARRRLGIRTPMQTAPSVTPQAATANPPTLNRPARHACAPRHATSASELSSPLPHLHRRVGCVGAVRRTR
jgi:hypothetical protein